MNIEELSADQLAFLNELRAESDAALAKREELHRDRIHERLRRAEAERDAALAENVALRLVADAAKDVLRFTEPEWRNDVDRGDADTKLAEALAALPARGGEGTK